MADSAVIHPISTTDGKKRRRRNRRRGNRGSKEKSTAVCMSDGVKWALYGLGTEFSSPKGWKEITRAQTIGLRQVSGTIDFTFDVTRTKDGKSIPVLLRK